MADTIIRQLQGKEMLETLYGLASYAFHPSPPLTDQEDWTHWISARQDSTFLVLFEDGVPVSCAVSTAMLQNVRGTLYDQSAVWGVVTAPSARRQGYSRRVMMAILAAAREAGQAFSCLYPFRESFYERLGYATFPAPLLARFTTASLAPLLKKELGGQIQWKRIGEGWEDYQAYLRQRLQQVHGMGVYAKADTTRKRYGCVWQVQARVEGRLEGLMLYELQGQDGDEGKFQFCARAFYYNTSLAKYLLLQWIARHEGQADRALLTLPPGERPETWLADLQVKPDVYRTPMGRVVDVAQIGGMQVGPGSMTLRIRDPLCPWNEGVWRLQSAAGRLEVTRAVEPEGELSIQGLSALVYGTHDVADFALRGWGDPSAPLQETMRRIFPPLLPYLDELF